MSYGIRVTKAGYNALTESDVNNYIFHSDYNTFKILKEGTANITYTADGVYTVAHNLSSYTATSYLVFVKFPDGYTALAAGLGETDSRNKDFLVFDTFVDSTNISLVIVRLAGSATALSIKYYIFETPLA